MRLSRTPVALFAFAVCLIGGCGRVHYDRPPASCAEIARDEPDAGSGTYEIMAAERTNVHCEMGRLGGGWTRVASVNPAEGSCAGDWQRRDADGIPVCTRPPSEGGSQSWATFAPPITSYTEVMGYVKGLQFGSMDTFSTAGHDGERGSLSTNYVDGVSIVAVDEMLVHVWTYAVAWSDTDNSERSLCPCLGGTPPPAFVDEAYFCEAGHPEAPESKWATGDPLWDGDGTGTDCDTPADPSRFHRELDHPLSGPLLVRLMADQSSDNEDVGVTDLKLYVR